MLRYSPRETAHNPYGCCAFRVGLRLAFQPDSCLSTACYGSSSAVLNHSHTLKKALPPFSRLDPIEK